MAWRGTVSRSLLYAATSSVGRSLPRARPHPIAAAPPLPYQVLNGNGNHGAAFVATSSRGSVFGNP